MNCERIQELILTDYLDGVLEGNVRKELEEHLALCPQCLQFAQTAKQTVVESFKGAERSGPPDHVWSRIENAIREDAQPVAYEIPSWLERLKALISTPRPAFVLGAVLVLFMAAGTFNHDQIKVRQAALSEPSAEYIVSLVEATTGVSVNDNDDFGTDVEQVFL